MQSFFYCLLNHPQVYQKTVAEIENAVNLRHISSSTFITYVEAQQLPCFQAALIESRRLRPAVALSISRYIQHRVQQLTEHGSLEALDSL